MQMAFKASKAVYPRLCSRTARHTGSGWHQSCAPLQESACDRDPGRATQTAPRHRPQSVVQALHLVLLSQCTVPQTG